MNTNNTKQRLLGVQRITQTCLLLIGAIALLGGTLQMTLGQPDTTPRLDNIHRFMAGVYMACGIISSWMAFTIRTQNTLVFIIAIGVLLGAIGRLISMSIVGLPEPHGLWITYVLLEIILPFILIVAQILANRKLNTGNQ